MLENDQVEHNSQDIYFRSIVGAAEAGARLRLGIRIRTSEPIRQVLVRLWQDRTGELLVPLETKDADGERRFYTCRVNLPDYGCLVWYYFIITAESGTYFYGNNEEMLGGIGALGRTAPASYQVTVYNRGARTPDWFKNAVMYQIFPDRFARSGDAIVRKKGAVIRTDWTDDPMYLKDPDTKEIVAYDFFGGNLRGIVEKLDYLADLGISCIYFNPVFESESNHHYDTGDYHKIDPMLGDIEDFRMLVKEARARGIRIILDGVFSHTGSNSIYFNRRGRYESIGAYQSKESPYYSWYRFRSYPNEYDCWWNFDTLPNVNETDPSYMDFVITGENSVLHYWMNEGIAGWRLDVIDELPPTFSKTFFAELKKHDPDAVMIGEVWEDASNKVAYGTPREYLSGCEMDAAMNYPLRAILFDFLMGNADGRLTARRLASQIENYPKENLYAMMNLIGSHDVQRAVTVLGGVPYYEGMPAVEQARVRMTPEQFELGSKRLLMATLWQMTYPGVPSVYYGDEIGMQGFKDPFNRRPYDWANGSKEIRGWVERFIEIRNKNDALRTGDILPLYGAGDVVAYARTIRSGYDVFNREKEDGVFIAAFNRNPSETMTIEADVSDFACGVFEDCFKPSRLYEAERGRLRIKIPPLYGLLLRERKEPRCYERKAGVLLHPTSLPSKYGVGDFGREAYRFVDFLAAAGQKVWQILPLSPVGYGYSPYQSISAFAGNIMLIDPEQLMEAGWLTEKDLFLPYQANTAFVDCDRVKQFKKKLLAKAYAAFREESEGNEEYRRFCSMEAYWLNDYALFHAAKEEYGRVPWTEWPEEIRGRDPAALKELAARRSDEIALDRFKQYIFHTQWNRLHDYAKKKGVEILGDMPIFIAQDSADVWANRRLFDLNEDGTPRTVAGVPPDYFSARGQLWGNPQYDWEAMAEDNYAWWKMRFQKLSEQVDIIRIDHFRGFESYWSIDGKAETAVNGRWLKGPGKAFFDEIERSLGTLRIVAEDLGIITPEVDRLREACGFPGMKVVQFMLVPNESGRVGFAVPENTIVYTGTHDNNTTVGWYLRDIDEVLRETLANMVGTTADRPQTICKRLVKAAYASNARMAIIPMQDLLALDERARMNTPGTVGINWRWSLKKDYLLQLDPGKLKDLCIRYHR
ncbi:4-alpha-glucanotransferase [Selenomonas sp. F0473]|uniref:4-alpha-glucanotransferase n=1 Tax=Selenomonas sp. F0473 TaxID=999423 RepID=UPI00029E3CDD|nr:4-alpha-glucanotransferase [Selenomonas sp. F0473]EKU70591.1 4-alpha-glucanotransferase [Selenomonas sp. F0473]